MIRRLADCKLNTFMSRYSEGHGSTFNNIDLSTEWFLKEVSGLILTLDRFQDEYGPMDLRVPGVSVYYQEGEPRLHLDVRPMMHHDLAFNDPPACHEYSGGSHGDAWALGCEMLQLLVWFIEGYDALQAFRSIVKAETNMNTLWGREPGRGVYIAETVTQKLVDLNVRSVHGKVTELVETVQELLQPECEKRLSVGSLMSIFSVG